MRSLLRGTDSQVGIGLLTGHRCSVWAVATVPTAPEPPQFLTGSADKTILLWSADYEQRRFFQGHTDVVRAIVVFSAQHFLSSSNDASIRLWDIASGSNLRTFYPDHQEFLYTYDYQFLTKFKLRLKNLTDWPNSIQLSMIHL